MKKLVRIFETAEKGLNKYIHPMLKNSKFLSVRELEMFIELGHSGGPDEQPALLKNDEVSCHNFARNESEIVLEKLDESVISPKISPEPKFINKRLNNNRRQNSKNLDLTKGAHIQLNQSSRNIKQSSPLVVVETEKEKKSKREFSMIR